MILQVEFLGPYAAAEHAARDAPEWPPHPDRLYQALIDAANLADPREEQALQWLEAQPGPGIACGDAVPLPGATTFVPVNYPGVPADPDQRTKQPRSFPMTLPREPVAFVWPDPEPPVLEVLATIAGRVSHVGRAESHAIVEVGPGRAGVDLAPDPAGPISLRVPHPGRLAALEQAFRAGRFGPAPVSTGYVATAERTAEGPWGEMIAVRLARPLSVENVVAVSDALRRAVLSHLGDAAPPVVHGHGEKDHVAWIGLPNLSPYARGELLGLALVLPRAIDPRARAECVRALLAVESIQVEGRRVGIERPTHALSLAARTWTQPSRLWASTTPVVLDRYPRRSLTAEQVVRDGISRAGYPEPKRVTLHSRGAVGGLPARGFRLRKPGKLHTHVLVEFAAPVRGPLLVGAERYFGLGLFLPMDARTPSDVKNPGGSRA